MNLIKYLLKFDKWLLSFCLFITSVMISSCNNNLGRGENSTPSNEKLLKSSQAPQMTMNMKWYIDGAEAPQGANPSLKDTLWHLVTMTVSYTDETTKPTAVEGLFAAIYPKPAVDVGQKIEVQDINCKTAIFSKVGDSCSAYFRLTYDTTKTVDRVVFPVEIEPDSNIMPGLLSFTTSYYPDMSEGIYRAVSKLEDKYYSGSQISGNRNNYSILLMQNGNLKPIKITTLDTPANPVFTIIHRTALGNDPYYGSWAECSLRDNASLNQVSHLDKQGDTCLVIYKASSSGTRTQESDVIKVATDAIAFTPADANKFYLIANYATGKPLPPAALTQPSGSLQEPMPFNNIDMSYTIRAINGGLNSANLMSIDKDKFIAKYNTLNVSPGTRILTNVTSAPVTIGSVNNVIDTVSRSGQKQAFAPNNTTTANWTLYIDTNLFFKNQIQLTSYVDGQGWWRCGMHDDNHGGTINLPIGIIQNDIQLGRGQHWGCDCWDAISEDDLLAGSGCNGTTCTYNFKVYAQHNQCDGGNHGEDTQYYQISFPKPQAYTILSNFSPSLPNTPLVNSFAIGGQSLSVNIGGQSGLVNQSYSYQGAPSTYTVSGKYSNGLSSNNMSYNITLNPGDIFLGGVVNFTRSSGYDLSDFNLTIK